MKYTKPEVAVLGEAVRVIEGTHIKSPNGTVADLPNMQRFIAAYDLDE
jgi:hypothetical protein